MVLWVTPESELTIAGKTNLNVFSCKYMNDLTDTLWIAIEQDRDVYHLQNTQVQLDVDAFDCGGKIINKDFRKLLKQEDFPEIVVKFESFTAPPEEQRNLLGSLNTRFELTGNAAVHTIDILKQSEHSRNTNYYGQTTLDITQFGLKPPSRLFGMVKVDKTIEVQFDLNVIVIKPFRAIGDE